MNKLILSLSAAMLMLVNGYGQSANYSFSQSLGTYTEITGGTVLGSTSNDEQKFVDPSVPAGSITTIGPGFPIGFDFIFEGISFDRFAVNTNAWISFGQSILSPSVNLNSTNVFEPCASVAPVTPSLLVCRVSALAMDIQGQAGSELRIETIGSAPNRECVIQWKKYRKYMATTDDLNFQIRLTETSNEVSFVYGNMVSGGTAKTAQVGLRGEPLNPATNWCNRFTTTNWESTQAGSLNTDKCTLSSTVFPVSGLKFKYKYSTRPANPESFKAKHNGSSEIKLDWTKNASGDSIIIAVNSTGIIGTPVEGVRLSEGSEIPGGGIVIYRGILDSFSHYGLDPDTRYYYSIWSVNGALEYSTGLYVNAATTFGYPYTEDFEKENLPATGWTGEMSVISGHGTLGTKGLSVLMSNTTPEEAVSPLIGTLTANSYLSFQYRIVDTANYPFNGTVLDLNDKIEIQVSNNLGNSYSTVYTINRSNHLSGSQYQGKTINLGTYDQSDILIRILCTPHGSKNFFIDFDNIRIGEGNLMTYGFSGLTQENNSIILSGNKYKEIICLKILTQNDDTPLLMKSITFSTNGSTNAGNDILSASVYYSQYPEFKYSYQYGDAVNSPGGNFTINLDATMVNGENFFWLVYDISPNATDQNLVDAECIQFVTSETSTPKTPDILNPPGSRKIRQPRGDFYIPGDYPGIEEAIQDLNGIEAVGTGGISFKVAAGHIETLSYSFAAEINATGTESNPIVFMKSGTGDNPLLIAGQGSSNWCDGVIVVTGGDYITFDGIDVLDPSSNINDFERMEWGFALLKKQDSAPVDGCQHVTIKNCKITLQKNNKASVGIYSGNHTTFSPTLLVPAQVADAMNFCRFYNNIISNAYTGIKLTGYDDNSPYLLYDSFNEIGVEGENMISDFGGGSTDSYGIFTRFQKDLKVANNSISGGDGTTAYLYGIWVNSISPANVDIYGNNIRLNYGGTNNSVYGIVNGCPTCYDNTEGVARVKINDNQVTECTLPNSASGLFSAIINKEKASKIIISANTISNNSKSGTGGFTGIYTDRGKSVAVFNNDLNNNYKNGKAGWMELVSASGDTCNIYNNRLINNGIPTSVSSNGPCDIYGIKVANSGLVNIFSNDIQGLSFSGTCNSASSDISAIFTERGTLVNNEKNIYRNNISGISALCGTVNVIFSQGGGLTRINNNSITDISNLQAADVLPESAISGISLHRELKTLVFNNFVSDLRTPASASPDAIRCIAVTSDIKYDDTVGIYHNSLYLNSVSTGSDFGSSGIYQYTDIYSIDVPNLDMRNNIIVNNSVSNGTGKTVAYRRSSQNPFTSYNELSNNNIFYAGIPGPGNLIYYDGTNSDQTLENFKARVAPRETLSSSEIPPFLNISAAPFDLHLDSLVNSTAKAGGKFVSDPVRIDIDFDGENRKETNPDIGADEFSNIPLLTGNRWMGIISTEWVNPGNWSGGVPDSLSTVIISKGNFPAILETTQKLENLSIEPASVLILNPGSKLTVKNSLENSGILLIKSYSGSSGSLIHHSLGVSAKVESYFNGDSSTDSSGWYLISSPVENQPVADFFNASGVVEYIFMGWNEILDSWLKPNEDPNLTHFIPGYGYAAWFKNEAIPVYNGVLNVSDLTVNNLSLTAGLGNGWHFLGNPFTSAISWNNGKGWSLENVSAMIQVWNFDTRSFSVLPPGGNIPPMSGFLVQALQNGAALTIPATSRVHATESPIGWDKEQIRLIAWDALDNSAQESILRFDPGAGNNYDPSYDARFMEGYAPRFYSRAGSDNLVLNTLPLLFDDLEVNYAFSASKSGSYSIEVQTSIPGAELYLNDLKVGIESNLTTSNPYIFTWQEGENPDRFILKFKPMFIDGLNSSQPNDLNAWISMNQLNVITSVPDTRVSIYDLLGRKIKIIDIWQAGKFNYSLNLKEGIYVVRLSSENAERVLKVYVK